MYMEARDEYNMLLENGELQEIYSEYNLVGDWKKDERKFLKAYEDNQKAMKDAESFILDLDADYEFGDI